MPDTSTADTISTSDDAAFLFAIRVIIGLTTTVTLTIGYAAYPIVKALL